MSDMFWTSLPALIASVVAGVISIMTYLRVGKVHYNVKDVDTRINGRMEQLIKINVEAAHAQGQLDAQAKMILDAAAVARELVKTAQIIASEKLKLELISSTVK